MLNLDLDLNLISEEDTVAVHLRLSRGGRKNLAFYRLVAADSRKPRDGRYLEILGTHDPAKHPPVTVRTLLKRAGVIKK